MQPNEDSKVISKLSYSPIEVSNDSYHLRTQGMLRRSSTWGHSLVDCTLWSYKI